MGQRQRCRCRKAKKHSIRGQRTNPSTFRRREIQWSIKDEIAVYVSRQSMEPLGTAEAWWKRASQLPGLKLLLECDSLEVALPGRPNYYKDGKDTVRGSDMWFVQKLPSGGRTEVRMYEPGQLSHLLATCLVCLQRLWNSYRHYLGGGEFSLPDWGKTTPVDNMQNLFRHVLILQRLLERTGRTRTASSKQTVEGSMSKSSRPVDVTSSGIDERRPSAVAETSCLASSGAMSTLWRPSSHCTRTTGGANTTRSGPLPSTGITSAVSAASTASGHRSRLARRVRKLVRSKRTPNASDTSHDESVPAQTSGRADTGSSVHNA